MSKNKLGFWSIVLLGINSIIGTGIFGLPNEAYAMVGVSSIWVILFDMMLAVSIALCFAEASGRFKNNGGPYLYAKEAFGNFFGFEVGLMKWFMSIIAWASFAAFFAQRIGILVPALNNQAGKIIVIVLTLGSLGIVNLLGVKSSKVVNNVITIGKLIPLILFISVGIFFINGGNFDPSISNIEVTSGGFVEASVLLFFAFTGFESIAIAAEDMENPDKNLPKAIAMVMLIVSVVYIAILAICIGVLGPKLATSNAPVADTAAIFLGPIGKSFILGGTIVSIAGINIAASFVTPRVAVALSETGVLPDIFAKNNKHGAPYVSIIVTIVLSGLLALSGQFQTLAALSVIVRFIQYIPTCISVMIFRKRMPNQKLNFKVPFGNFIPMFATLVSIWLLVKVGIGKPSKIVFGLGGLVIVAPLYLVMKDNMLAKDKEKSCS